MEEKNCENQELELDLIELCKELKNNIALIVTATVICAAAAAAYLHFMTVPVYSYTRMIKLPENGLIRLSDQDKFSFINILKLDMTNPELWKDSAKGRLVNINLVSEKHLNTNLITFQFSGTDPAYLKKVSDEYTETAVQKLNNSIKELKDANFNKYTNELVRDELKGLRLALTQSSVSGESVQQALTNLEKRLNSLENNEAFTAKVIDNANATATVITNKSLFKKGAALGFVLSIMFVFCRYCWRKAKDTGLI